MRSLPGLAIFHYHHHLLRHISQHNQVMAVSGRTFQEHMIIF